MTELHDVYGAIGDGTSHPLSSVYGSLAAAQAVYPHATSLTDEIDWAAIQAMINAVGVARLGHGKSYKTNRTVTLTVDGSGLICDGLATILPDMTYFANEQRSGMYNANALVIEARGLLSGAFTPVRNVRLAGLVIDGGVTGDGSTGVNSMLRVVLARNVENFQAERVHIKRFGVGHGFSIASAVGNGVVRDCSVTDWYNNRDWKALNGGDYSLGAIASQQTGICFDDDRVNSVPVSNFLVDGFYCARLLKGATAIAAQGRQNDGIQLGASVTHKITVVNSRFYNVDEGVDTTGPFACNVSHNTFERITGAAIKLIHGAHDNIYEANVIKDFDLWGIVVAAGAAAVYGNIIRGNHISHPTSSATAGIRFEDEATGPKCEKNYSINNYLDMSGSTVGHCLTSLLNQGRNYSHGDIFAAPSASGENGGYVNEGDANLGKLVIRSPVNPSILRVVLGSNQTFTGNAVVQFNTVEVDTRGASEFNTETYRFNPVLPGMYRIKAQGRFSAVPINSDVSMRLRLNGNQEIASVAIYETESGAETFEVSTVRYVDENDYLEVLMIFGVVPSNTMTASTALTFLEIEML